MDEKKSLTLKELKFVKLWDCLAYSFRKNMMKRKRPLPKMSLMHGTLSFLGPTPQNVKCQQFYLASKLMTRRRFQLLANFIIAKLQYNFWKNYVWYKNERLHRKTQPIIFVSIWFSSLKVTQPNMACGVFIDLKKPLILWITIIYRVSQG